ncbi:hypothetical protein LEM8419_02400 [Neolewinella maritima]|uniref:Uncharacterized protein n=1 Tax=Neolewinella maritima TaxID=1383882 RepID=A0ABM9B2E8_9BACT|nr:hypothetical protein [Neolewinella maritima]CAH1001497.1 hypothetical protein LEM8419_02400 [Neolewinella maritima]
MSSTPTTIAYAFDQEGQLLEKQSVNGQEIAFEQSEDGAEIARVFVLPEPPEGAVDEELTVERLERAEAYEPVLRVANGRLLATNRIPDGLIDRWRWVRCNARGKVTKTFIIDGRREERPICGATVHVCEVDPLLKRIPQLSDRLVLDLRDRLIPKLPDPLPPPPRGILPTPPQPPLPEPPIKLAKAAPQLHGQLRRADASGIRNLLTAHLDVLRPYLCLLPRYWNYFYRCDELRTARTDRNGRFEAPFFYQRGGDVPDLYFWVEFPIDGTLRTVYRPPIHCNTHWNYRCGKEVGLHITDPRVPLTCERAVTGQVAWIKTVGTATNVRSIQQRFSATIPYNSETFRTVGLTNFATSGLGSYGLAGRQVRPFASDLSFRVQFGSGFPNNEARYFRWMYRRTHNDKLVAAATSWKPLTEAKLRKPYTIEVEIGGNTIFMTRHYQLHEVPDGVVGYRIPPVSPKVAEVSGNPTAEWLSQNTITASFDSAGLPSDGLYEFKFELLDKDGNVSGLPANPFHLTDDMLAGRSEPAEPGYLLPADGVAHGAFRMRMRVDNQRCTARIYNIAVDGNRASTECGFVTYNDKQTSEATFRFEASHPNDFAVFNFNVQRGTSSDPLAEADTRGFVLASTTDGYTLAGGTYSEEVSVKRLLRGCDQAAFAEHLGVYGLHTNGSTTLSSFNASDLAAFALEPATS